MTSRPTSASIIALIVMSYAATDRPARADTIVPVTQDRFTSVQLHTDCDGATSDGAAADGFEPFDSAIDTSQQCPDEPILALVSANQNSTIGGTSLTLFANASYYVQTPGSAFASAVSSVAVTFELPRRSIVSISGMMLGDGQVPGAEVSVQLVGPGGETVISGALSGPFPLGEATEQAVDERLTLGPGAYALQAQAVAADAFDIGAATFAGETALNLAIDVAVLGDLDGDERVGVSDLLTLLIDWGSCAAPCPPACPADVNGDCTVDVADLLALLGNWG